MTVYRLIVLVVEVLALAPHDLEGVALVEEFAGGADVLLPQLDRAPLGQLVPLVRHAQL